MSSIYTTDNSDSACDCIFLPNEECCRKCILAPWQFTIRRKMEMLLHSYASCVPMLLSNVDMMKKQILTDVRNAIYNNYKNGTPRENTSKLIERTFNESYATFIRQQHQQQSGN